MQSARVKRVLAPVHNALYDHITSFGWCVRGDVTKGDFEAVVNDRRNGECFISGDYKSATDGIYLESVEVIIDEISKSKELTDVEREVLVGSFRDIEYRLSLGGDGSFSPIKRGSMMGNLVSFPLLCLLNKSCFDMACDKRDPKIRNRIGRFNGDDCMFSGDMSFMTIWRGVTGRYGLVVNEEKTGFSRRWLELNSQPYDVSSRSLVSKPVLSFLLPSNSVLSGLLTGILEGTKSFDRSVTKRVLEMMRFEISACGVLGDLSSLGPYWRKVLVKRRWFRAAAIFGGAPVLSTGVDRERPVVVGPPPYPRFFEMITRLSVLDQRDHLSEWKGVAIRKRCTKKLDKKTFRRGRTKMNQANALRKFAWIGYVWAFVWPKSVYDVVKRDFPFMLMSWKDRIRNKWLEDHPFLVRHPRVCETRKVRVNFYPPPSSYSIESDRKKCRTTV
jgi:hypothetical protein